MVAAVAATTVGQLPVFLTGALSVQIGGSMDLPADRLGIIVAAFFGSSALCNAWFGGLADRTGGPQLMRWGIAPAVISLALIGAVVRHWQGLACALLIAGISNGTIQPAANRHLTRAANPARQGLAFGVKQAAIPAATLLSGISVPAVAHTAGWRWAYVGAALLAVCVSVLIRPSARPTVGRRARQCVAFDRKPLIVLAVGLCVAAAATNAIGSYFVLSARAIGVSDSIAGLTAAVGSAVSLLVRIGAGMYADHRSTGRVQLVVGLCAFGAIGPLLLATEQRYLLVAAAVIGYGAAWGWSGLLNFVVARAYISAPGRATGITGVGVSIGACFGPLVFGIIASHVGYQPAWALAAVFLLVAATLIVVSGQMLIASTGSLGAMRGDHAPARRPDED